jgi:signal transduction histidine kinase
VVIRAEAPSQPFNSDPQALPFLAGGGEMGARIRALDWSRRGLGPPHTWPKSLRTCVRIILTSSQPMFVWWGDELINLYNDAYKAILRGKHPEALGQPASLVWREIWREIEPRVHSVLNENTGTYDEALLLIMERNGYPEETYYTFSYSPVPDDDGVTTGGIICANTDDTQRIIGQRQLATLSALAARGAESRSVEDACNQMGQTLEQASRDLPFSLIYLIEPEKKQAVLVGQSGIAAGHSAAPAQLALDGLAPWLIGDALQSAKPLLIERLGPELGQLPCGAWDEAPSRAAIVRVPATGGGGAAAVLIAGLNPFRLFDEGYESFLNLVAGQIGTSIANASAYERERQRAEALAELDRAKTAFFSNVSHEFRTPLTLMLGPIEDALRSPERNLGGENLETAYRSCLRLVKLVNSLLDFARIEAGRAQASFEATDLRALTSDLASAFRSAIERAGLAFHVDCRLDEQVFVDHDMWEKIVLNLLSNALKYTFDGSIALTLRGVDGFAELVVSDTGTGIAEHELPRIFERFHRVQGARSRTHEGTGIGLALVHELVRIHAGQITAQSIVDGGTRFTVRVPRGSSHLAPERIATPGALASTAIGAAAYVEEAYRWLPDSRRQGAERITPPSTLPVPELSAERDTAHVLVADDNADMREYLARLLGERWHVTAVADGAQALEVIERQPPDLVLTDVMMPNLDGFGLLSAIRENARTSALPVLMLSARAGDEASSSGLEAGADDYLTKPFSARELLARVATHLHIARLRGDAQRERQRLFDIFQQAPAPVAVLAGPQLRFEVANPSFCEMVGRSELVGRALREAFFEPDALEAIGSGEQAYQAGRTLYVNEQQVRLMRNGQLSDGYFSYVAQPIFDGSETTGVIVVATEVTESVLARQRVDGLRQTAERANRAKDEFLSTLSHELRTPLNAIVGWSRLLRTGSVPADQSQRALDTIERNARVQARLVEDMLDLSRIEQGKLVLSVGPLEMVRVVEAAIEALRPAAEAKQIRLQPVLDSYATIVGDADRLQQVVWNLLSNAIKFTPRGGRVQLQLRSEHSHVEVSVSDNGQGIEPEFLPHVFDRFRQGDQSFTRHAGGLGLGLAIVRSLVELHGGVVAAESNGRDQGATFVVRLPVAPLRADSAPVGRSPASSQLSDAPTFERPESLRDLRVLVVDDEPETRALIQFVIEQCAAKVVTAGSVAEGLETLERGNFDLLISDIGMPGEDGYSFIRKVRDLSPEASGRIPALALTAYARVEDRTAALRAGFNMHLTKPIDPNELLVVLETLMRGMAR